MSNPNPIIPEEHKWKPGESGNPKGRPKGSLNISTRIQQMLEDPEFELKLKNGQILKGAPIEVITKTAIALAASGDMKAYNLLLKYTVGNKQIHEFEDSPIDKILEKYGLKDTGIKKDGEEKENAG